VSNDFPPRLSELLDPAARRAGIEDGTRTGMVWNRWSSIVGPDVAKHAEPSSLRGGVLRVRTDSPAWATELTYLAEEIKSRTNAAVGAPLVAEVRVWTGPGRIRPPRSATPISHRPAPEGASPDPDPLGALDRALAAWRARRPRADPGRGDRGSKG